MTSTLSRGAALIDIDADTTVGALRVCTGATAALDGDIPVASIKLLGRWRSNEVFRYLYTQSEPLMAPLAARMFA
jgi:hypothetical protein